MKYIIAILIVLVVVLGYMAFVPVHKLGAVLPSWTVTNSSATCGVDSSQAIAADSSLSFRYISNIGASNVYLWLSSTSTGISAGKGILITPSSTWEMTDLGGDMWTGTIFCITSVGTDTLSYSQW